MAAYAHVPVLVRLVQYSGNRYHGVGLECADCLPDARPQC